MESGVLASFTSDGVLKNLTFFPFFLVGSLFSSFIYLFVYFWFGVKGSCFNYK